MDYPNGDWLWAEGENDTKRKEKFSDLEMKRYNRYMDFPGGSVVKYLPANAGDTGDAGLIPGVGGSPGEGNGNPLQYSCLENRMHRGTRRAIVHGIAKSWIRFSKWIVTEHHEATNML